MFPQQNRLIHKKDFDFVFKRGVSGFDLNLGIKAVNNKLTHSRFGIIVSNKISKKAIERNKVKRRIREILKIENQRIKKNIDFVVITLAPIKNSAFREIEKSLQKNIDTVIKKLR